MYLSSLLTVEAVLDVFSNVALWTIIGILAHLVVAGILLLIFSKILKKDIFSVYAKYACIGFFALLLVLAIVFFSLDLAKTYREDDPSTAVKTLVLIPLLCLAVCALISLTAYAITDKVCPKAKRYVLLVGGIFCAISVVAVIVCLIVFYNKNIAGDGYYNSDTATVKQVGLYLSAFGMILLLVGACFLDKKKLTFDSRSIALAGVCAGMSYALSYIKLWDMPNGGSVTLVSMLPIMIYAYIFGVKKGIVLGVLYGTLQAVQDPWIIHPAQFVLDYPLAFGMCGLAGLFAPLSLSRKIPQLTFSMGIVVGGSMRVFCHILAGALAFEAYAGGQNPWLFSLLYNSVIFIDVALVIVAGIILFSSRAFVRTATSASKTKSKQS